MDEYVACSGRFEGLTRRPSLHQMPTHAIRDRGDEAGPLGCCTVFDVPDVAGVVAGVDDHGTGFDPVPFDKFRTAHGGNHDVSVGDRCGQVRGLRVAVGEGRITP